MAVQRPPGDYRHKIIPQGSPHGSEPESKGVVAIVPVDDGILDTIDSNQWRMPHDVADKIKDGEP